MRMTAPSSGTNLPCKWRLRGTGKMASVAATPGRQHRINDRNPFRSFGPHGLGFADDDARLKHQSACAPVPNSGRVVGYPDATLQFHSCAPRRSSRPEDTPHLRNRERLRPGPSFKRRRILSNVLHEEDAPILRVNSGIYHRKVQILNNVILRCGPGRDRTDDLPGWPGRAAFLSAM
jgi:hypothetical protein